jgi:hypothetical protein
MASWYGEASDVGLIIKSDLADGVKRWLGLGVGGLLIVLGTGTASRSEPLSVPLSNTAVAELQ